MNYDIFISYKRRGSSLATAPYLFSLLQQKGYDVFLDTKEMRSGHFDDQLLKYISNAKDIIILLEEESLRSWFDEKDKIAMEGKSGADDGNADNEAGEDSGSIGSGDGSMMENKEPLYRTDWFVKEVMHALSLEGKRIIPLLLNGYRMPESKDLPPELASLPRNQALSVDLSDMEHMIQKYFIDMEYLTSKPKNLALSRQYQSKGGIIGNFLFYTSAESCELNEYGEKIITLTGDYDEKHPFKYPVTFAGEHRFHLFNNDTCEEMMISQTIDPNCQRYICVEWKEGVCLWNLTQEAISMQDDPEKLFFWGTSLFNGTVKNAPDLGRALQCLERAVDMDYQPAVDFMRESGGLSSDTAGGDVMFRWYTLADRCGSLDGCRKLGVAYCYGEGVERSYEKAVEIFTKVAEKGNAQAQFNLALMYYRGLGVEKSYEKAAELYTKAAEKGNARAQFNLALMYYRGEGVEKSFEKAAELYAKAAEKDHANAQYSLALMYYKGEGVEKSFEKAAELYAKAAEKDHANAQYNLALMYDRGEGVEKSFEKAAELYAKAAEKGHTNAQYSLALMYLSGEGVEKSFEKAAEIFAKAAEKDHANAQYSLASMYYTGKGVEKSYEKAAELYAKAAEKGHNGAKCRLGHMYSDGSGVEQSFEKATELYRKAADQQYKEAYNGLAWTYHLMGRYEEALPWAEKAMESFPDNPDILDTMASVLQDLGRYDEAMSKFVECLERYRSRQNEDCVRRTEERIESLRGLMHDC